MWSTGGALFFFLLKRGWWFVSTVRIVAGALDESFSNESRLEIWTAEFFNRDEFFLGVEDVSLLSMAQNLLY